MDKIVRCIDNRRNAIEYLTVDKCYTVIKEEHSFGMEFYYITSDTGEMGGWDKSRFVIALDEMRNVKLEELLYCGADSQSEYG